MRIGNFMAFLSLMLLLSTVSAVVIEDIDVTDPIVNPVIDQGENINVALIKAYIDEKEKNMENSIQFVVDSKIEEFNIKVDEIVVETQFKLGIGVATICLFLFNLFLAQKLLVEGVFK